VDSWQTWTLEDTHCTQALLRRKSPNDDCREYVQKIEIRFGRSRLNPVITKILRHWFSPASTSIMKP
jgi:hypothetical protein